MPVESIQILHKDGRTENVGAATQGHIMNGGSQVQVHRSQTIHGGAPSMIPAPPAVVQEAPRQEAPPFIVFVDPDLFGDSAPDVARWLTLAGLGIFAVGTGKTAWPATMSADQNALRNLFRRVAVLRAGCKGERRSGVALEALARPPTDRPPPRKAKPRASPSSPASPPKKGGR